MSRSNVTLTAVLVATLVLPLVIARLVRGEVYWLFIVSEFFVFAIVALSLDLLTGRSGQISLGQSGFFAVGAYAAAILNTRYHVDLAGGAIAGGILAAIASLVVGFPATRLRGHYLGIVTFGYGISVDQIALQWDALTGGDQGIHLHHPTFLGLDVRSPVAMYYVTLGALAVVSLLVWNLTRTRIGRSFTAMRDSEVAAAAMGIPIARTKVLAFVCSAFLAGFAGAFYAFLAGFVAPEDFGIDQTLLFFAMVVVGGMCSIPGTIAGALLVDVLEQAASTVSGLSLAIVGGMTVAVVLFFPSGLKGLLRWRRRRSNTVYLAAAGRERAG